MQKEEVRNERKLKNRMEHGSIQAKDEVEANHTQGIMLAAPYGLYSAIKMISMSQLESHS